MNNMQYIIPEHNTDPRQSIIEKHGDVWKFTYQDILNAKQFNNKQTKELLGNILVAQKKVDNCKEYHPAILELTPEQRVAAGIYQENLAFIEKANEKIKEISDTCSKMDEDLKVIFEQNPDFKALIDEINNKITDDENPKEQE